MLSSMETAPLRVMALHALAYCERLFYLEEIEEIRVADDRVYAGRTLHEQLDEEGEFVTLTVESPTLDLRGKVDAIRRRDGSVLVYEHKRGRSRTDEDGPAAWPSDRLQVGAYAMLVEEGLGQPIPEGRVRYHADHTLVKVPIDAALRADVRQAVARARELARTPSRPPVTDNERLCARCSLAPVCLPEETRKALHPERASVRLFPRDDERRVVHVDGHGTTVGRKGDQLAVRPRDGEPSYEPIRQVGSVVAHGYASFSAQALQLCADHGVAVHWFGAGGWYLGSFWREDLAVQRRIRQYEALRDPAFRLALARRLVHARVEGQLRFILRATRKQRDADGLADGLRDMRQSLAAIGAADGPDALLGLEGNAAAAYFACLRHLVSEDVDRCFVPDGRSRRPPADRFNALLSFGYALLLKDVVQAIRAVGLDAAFGLYHTPRSAAPPLALDLIELFRVPCVDMAVVAAVNRRQFDPDADFQVAGRQVWLTDSGRHKLIGVYERRMLDVWRHPVLDYSLSYRRHVELEVRLLEKEWSGEGGGFGRTRMR